MFTFNVSLSVLNHLGRNLYRNFSTVLGEAISNAWDADAKNVYIQIDRENNSFSILDDGIGMTESDFQDKFLRVGYSKRDVLHTSRSNKGRPFIGRKGIGKLALLSCSEKLSIVTKQTNTDLIGGIINNPNLDQAITDNDEKYPLEDITSFLQSGQVPEIQHGTFLFFENLHAQIYNSIEYIRYIIAMFFRFSIIQYDGIDADFHIFVNGSEVNVDDLETLVDKTEFVWKINSLSTDPLVNKICERSNVVCEHIPVRIGDDLSLINGFVATVEKPSDLKIRGMEEHASLDLFVNGRLREKDILRHIKTNRIVDSYIYGQINYNSMDDEVDRFTTSRESVKADDPKFQVFLRIVKEQVINKILERWDELRDNRGKDGDSENTTRMDKKTRKGKELFNATIKEYENNVDGSELPIREWIQKLGDESKCNFPSYAECFIAENLIREYIKYKNITPTSEENREANSKQTQEQNNKVKCGMSIPIRQLVYNNGTEYLSMDWLADIADRGNAGQRYSLQDQGKTFKPIRDALMHTAFLTQEAKIKLTSVFNEIKARVTTIITATEPSDH